MSSTQGRALSCRPVRGLRSSSTARGGLAGQNPEVQHLEVGGLALQLHSIAGQLLGLGVDRLGQHRLAGDDGGGRRLVHPGRSWRGCLLARDSRQREYRRGGQILWQAAVLRGQQSQQNVSHHFSSTLPAGGRRAAARRPARDPPAFCPRARCGWLVGGHSALAAAGET